jgi:predicted RND superfamily exporter protein
MWIYGFNWSVAVWVGFIALYGVAVQTGVVMVLYLHEALDRRMLDGEVTPEEIFEATVEGALLRVRPKVMTVATTVFGLVPLLWATGAGSGVMKPIAVPLIGGMVTSTVHVLLVTPIIFFIVKRRELARGRLKLSGLRATEELQEDDEAPTHIPADDIAIANVGEAGVPDPEAGREHRFTSRQKKRLAIIVVGVSLAALAIAGSLLVLRDSPGERIVLDSEIVSNVATTLSSMGRPRAGANEFEIAFADPTSDAPIEVTDLSAEIVMRAMGSMPQMTEQVEIEKTDEPGRYAARGKLSMKGTWQFRVRFTARGGPKQAVFEVNVQ